MSGDLGLSDLLCAVESAGFGYELKTLDGSVKDGEGTRRHSLEISTGDFTITMTGDRESLLSTAPMLIPQLKDGAALFRGQGPDIDA